MSDMNQWLRRAAGKAELEPTNQEVRRLAERLEATGTPPVRSEQAAAELLGTEAPPPTDFGGGPRGQAPTRRRDSINDRIREAHRSRSWTESTDR